MTQPFDAMRSSSADRKASMDEARAHFAAACELLDLPTALEREATLRAAATLLREAIQCARGGHAWEAPSGGMALEAQVLQLRREALAMVGASSAWQRVDVVRPVVAAGLVFFAVALGLVLRSALSPVNIGLHKSAIVSSQAPGSGWPGGATDGNRSELGFMTTHEKQPWVRIDLGELAQLSAVRVFNHNEHHARPLPLVVEVSTDGDLWRETARTEYIFTSWKAEFDKVEARYVRLRSLSDTTLHLNEIELYDD